MKMISHAIRINLQGMILFLVIVFAGRQAEAVGGKVLTTDGQTISATSIRYKKTTQEYILLTSDNVERPLAKAKVKKLAIDKPAKYDQAVAALNSGKADEAIAMLDDIFAEVYMLSPWDAQVLDLLGRIYTTKKPDKALALATYEKLLRNALPEGITPEIKQRAWAVLIESKPEALKKEIEDTIATGTRANAAAAYIARGDMARQAKNPSDAFIDYMRVVLLFEQVKELQPQALYKAMKCMEDLKDTRAGELRRDLAQKYPQSEWASKQ